MTLRSKDVEWKAQTRAESTGTKLFPRCADPGCSRVRGLWRRMYAWDGGLRLHGEWYCAPQCFENALAQRLGRIGLPAAAARAVRHRVPLGLLMLSRGQLNNRQLRSALDAQRAQGNGRIGQWIEQLGFATEQQVTAALGVQWACPVLPVFNDFGHAAMLPFRLLRDFRLLPVRYVPQVRKLYVAFSDRVEYPVLYAIEQMLNCTTEPCIVATSTMDAALERLAHERRTGELMFEGWRQAQEVAHVTCGYALKLGVKDVRTAGCGNYIWARLQGAPDTTDLLFHRFATQHLDRDLA